MRLSSLILSLLCILPTALRADDGPDLWLTFNAPKFDLGKNTKTNTQLNLRFPEVDELGYYYIAQKISTKLNDKWSLGTNPVFESSKKGDEWTNTYRLDLELNPAKFNLGENGPSISLRNRWELRWKEGKGSEIFHRIRQMARATWTIDAGPFTSFAIANEVFFEEDKGKITKNRFYPVMLGSKLGDNKVSYYLMYDSSRKGTSDDWNGRYILGSTFSF